MNALIFAIASCVSAGSSNYCNLIGQPFVFSSADQCLHTMSAKLGGGRHLVDGRLYTTQPGASKTWLECEERPTSQWQAVQAPSPLAVAEDFKRESYALIRCSGPLCKTSSVPLVSEKACKIAMELAIENDGDRDARYECSKVH